MKFFNALQVVFFFCVMPFGINWMRTDPFPYAGIAFWLALVTYLVYFGWMVYMVYDHFCKENK